MVLAHRAAMHYRMCFREAMKYSSCQRVTRPVQDKSDAAGFVMGYQENDASAEFRIGQEWVCDEEQTGTGGSSNPVRNGACHAFKVLIRILWQKQEGL